MSALYIYTNAPMAAILQAAKTAGVNDYYVDRRLVISDSSIDLFHIGIELLKAGHLDTRVIVLY